MRGREATKLLLKTIEDQEEEASTAKLAVKRLIGQSECDSNGLSNRLPPAKCFVCALYHMDKQDNA